jgi:hypothetical protein
MGSDGAGPRPWKQRQARTIFLRVPHAEWDRVSTGRKGEFRASPRAMPQLWDVEPPLPVVAYTISPQRGYLRELMVLTATWRERLEDISAESLAAEGYPTFAHFRRGWMIREKTKFMPTREVSVFQVRPWEPADERRMADRLFERLYGAYRG